MYDRNFAKLHLKAIEKNADYFNEAKLFILDCVRLRGKKIISVHVLIKDLPHEIIYDIETMFWKD